MTVPHNRVNLCGVLKKFLVLVIHLFLKNISCMHRHSKILCFENCGLSKLGPLPITQDRFACISNESRIHKEPCHEEHSNSEEDDC